ncbi:MAG: cytochrome c3 family protein, partial [Planctomycetota bacterium]
ADNSRCHVCHINYDEEELALNHELGGVSCEKCHGSSDAHCSDENNITPPDIMYSKASVNPSCMKCHSKEEIIEEGHHKPLFSGAVTQMKYCTDCHGREHRIPVRTVRWDKTTGKLLVAGE